nr:hypothetical protein [uncultured Pseudomonas sp.]
MKGVEPISLAALIIGVIAQIFFAGLQGRIVVFSASAIANNSELTPFQDRLLATLMLESPSPPSRCWWSAT